MVTNAEFSMLSSVTINYYCYYYLKKFAEIPKKKTVSAGFSPLETDFHY